MSEQGGDQGAWFRRRRFGYGYSVASWQGVLATVVFVAILLVTVFAGDPNTARPSSLPVFLRMKTMLGLGDTHLPVPVMLVLILTEIAAFLGLIWWTSRPVKSLD
jgi:hypothetical protein